MSEPVNPTPGSGVERPALGDAILRLLDRPVAPAELESGAELAARPMAPGNRRASRYLLFRVGDETAALVATALRRVTPVVRTRPIPHRVSGVLRGVCNIRGELVLCADLHRLLGLARGGAGADEGTASDPRRMVVAGPADNSWAFEVDALVGIESIDPAEIHAPPVTVEYALADFTAGVTEAGGRSVTILDAERVLAGFKAGLA